MKSIDEYEKNLLGVRQAIPQMLDLFREYNIHVTWAVVGFLFFDKKEDLLNNIPSSIPNYTNKSYSPFEYLKKIGSDENSDPFHYGKSLIDHISSYPNQEIASHSFSHYYCLEEGQDIHSFEADIDKAIEVARNRGVELKSYVFPRNQENKDYLALLYKKGITSYRGNEKTFMYSANQRHKNNKIKRIFRLIDSYVILTGYNTYKVVEKSHQKPYNLPSSMYLRSYYPKLFFLESLKIRRIKKTMLHAALNNEMFHLWWHPHNFGANINENINNLKIILEYFEFLKNKYGMMSMNMSEISDKLVSNDSQ